MAAQIPHETQMGCSARWPFPEEEAISPLEPLMVTSPAKLFFSFPEAASKNAVVNVSYRLQIENGLWEAASFEQGTVSLS